MKKILFALSLLSVLFSCVDNIEDNDEEIIDVTSLTISEKSISIFENEEKTLTAEIKPSNATDKTITWSSDNEAVATVSDGRIKGIKEGQALITAKAGALSASCNVTVVKPAPIGPSSEKMVDLGLSVKWAGWNVGANRPEEFGDYFSWGETSPKPSYWQDDYKYGLINKYGYDNVIYKYNVKEEYGEVDGRTRLSATDDAAYVNWGPEWRMPTDEEKTELLANTVHARYVLNNVPGWLFTSKINGVAIFFPATGVKEQLNTSFVGEETIFWTATLRSNDPRMAHIACNWIEDSELLHEAGFEMDPTAESFHLSKWRYYGLPVRAVSGSPIPDDSYTLVTSPAEGITPFSAKVKVTIKPGDAKTSEFGLLYTYMDDTPLLPGRAESAQAGTDGIVLVQGLLANRIYRACAYAIVDGIKYYGNEISFQTREMITLEALGVEEVTSGSAKMNGRVGDIESLKAYGIDIECGIAYDKTNYGYNTLSGESSHLTLVPDGDGLITGTARALSSHTEYYYRAYLKVGSSYYFSSNYTKFTTQYPALDKWVDLGLSVMWASWDIGAESGADKTGYKFSWGETQPKEYYDFTNYKWGTGSTRLTKYVTDSKYGSVDNKTTLERDDDAASAAWGIQGARTPTKAEFDELLSKCTITKDFYMSNERVKFTGPNGNFIYLNIYSDYWTSSLDESDNSRAHSVYVAYPKDYIRQESYARQGNRLVRAVKPVEEVIN